MKAVKTLAVGWAGYDEQVIPAWAGAVQRTETRRAFYAGASYFFDTLMSGLHPDEEVTDADMDRLNSLKGEIDGFMEAVKAGRA